MERKDALDAGAEAYAADSEGSARGATFLRDHHTFKGLDAFFDLFAFAFEEADIDADGIARAEVGQIFAQLHIMEFTNHRIHFRCSLQTHSGGASSSKTNHNYRRLSENLLLRAITWSAPFKEKPGTIETAKAMNAFRDSSCGSLARNSFDNFIRPNHRLARDRERH